MAKSLKGQPKTGLTTRGRLRPHVWKCGPDVYRHNMYTPWQVHKAQANYRGEPHDLTFDDFFDIWNGHWHLRGRHADDVCLTRIDASLPWHPGNCQLRVRREHLAEQNGLKSKFNNRDSK